MANKYTNRNLLDYNFNENDYDNVSLAKKTALDAATKYNSIGDWKYGDEDAFSKAKDALTNRKAFSYDLNGDVLYQQYKDNYITQGKQAMMDTMGQAAAMTGGYGNSYAATVGNQTYQGYLQGLNDRVPELYQMAMQKYKMDGDQLKTAYDVLNSDRELDYSKFMDNKAMLQNDMQIYSNLYDAAYNRELTNYNNSLNTNNENYWNEYNTGYKAEQDALSHDLALKQLKLQQDELAWSKSQSDIAAKYSNYINPDDVEVDENGNITSIKGYTLAGSNSEGTTAVGHVSNNFRTKSGDNFDVEVGGQKYRVENQGKVTNTTTKTNLDKISADDGQVVSHNGKMYVKKDSDYYEIGSTEFLFWSTKGYKDLYNALNG